MTIRLVVSDVDGTLVAPDKSLPASAIAAAGRLRAAGVPLAIVSARPPFGMRYVAEGVRPAAMAGFNGGTILSGDGRVLERHLLPEAAGREALALLAERRIPAWLFTPDEWLITDPAAHHVALETHTVRQPPRVVPCLEPYLAECGKIVGHSPDHAALAAVEAELQARLGCRAAARRSQAYYLDVTNRVADKGFALRALCAQLGIDIAHTACIGDAPNDLPMLEIAGLAIAMGNAEPAVKARAAEIAGGNDADGWADAIDRLILPQIRTAA